MVKVKVSGNLHYADVSGTETDRTWGNRKSKSITLSMDHATAAATFVDDGAFLIKN